MVEGAKSSLLVWAERQRLRRGKNESQTVLDTKSLDVAGTQKGWPALVPASGPRGRTGGAQRGDQKVQGRGMEQGNKPGRGWGTG